jgi:hypothetical protein
MTARRGPVSCSALLGSALDRALYGPEMGTCQWSSSSNESIKVTTRASSTQLRNRLTRTLVASAIGDPGLVGVLVRPTEQLTELAMTVEKVDKGFALVRKPHVNRLVRNGAALASVGDGGRPSLEETIEVEVRRALSGRAA